MKRLFFAAICLLLMKGLFGQKEDLRLQNGGKIKTLNTDLFMDFTINTTGDSLTYGSIVYKGKFKEAYDNGIYFERYLADRSSGMENCKLNRLSCQ
ncbi:hypothetical protein ACFLT1_07565 [Bacteroidota bacterium]